MTRPGPEEHPNRRPFGCYTEGMRDDGRPTRLTVRLEIHARAAALTLRDNPQHRNLGKEGLVLRAHGGTGEEPFDQRSLLWGGRTPLRLHTGCLQWSSLTRPSVTRPEIFASRNVRSARIFRASVVI